MMTTTAKIRSLPSPYQLHLVVPKVGTASAPLVTDVGTRYNQAQNAATLLITVPTVLIATFPMHARQDSQRKV